MSSYKKFELIVVDNASTDKTYENIQKNYSNKLTLVRSEINVLAGGGRNLGAAKAKGEYLLFIDDDNVIDVDMVLNLVRSLDNHSKVGIVGPLMFYKSEPTRIWFAGADINLITSKTTYFDHNEIYKGQLIKMMPTGHIPNVITIRKTIFDQLGGFDIISFPMHYEESDIAERVREAGFKVMINPIAKCWHDTPLNTSEKKGQGLALNDSLRAFYNSRNRILFMRKYGKDYLLFVLLYLPVFSTYYLYTLLKIRQPKLISSYLKGVISGLFTKY